VLGNVEGSDGFREGNEDRMAGIALIAGVEFGLPLVEQGEDAAGSPTSSPDRRRCGSRRRRSGNLAQFFGQEPGGDGEVFVVRAGELAADLALPRAMARDRDGVGGGQAAPAVTVERAIAEESVVVAGII